MPFSVAAGTPFAARVRLSVEATIDIWPPMAGHLGKQDPRLPGCIVDPGQSLGVGQQPRGCPPSTGTIHVSIVAPSGRGSMRRS